MKIITLSDTHGFHDQVKLPEGDILIHAGDISMRGALYEVRNFLSWFEQQDFSTKIFIAGNHDFYFEEHTAEEIKSIMPDGVIYLDDSGIDIHGIKIWGSPVTPWFFDWAFNRNRGAEISKHWELIPADTDILVTHGPMFRRLDKTTNGEYAGCKDLFLRSQHLRLKAHICGHIHEAYGQLRKEETLFINASVVNMHYAVVNPPIVFEL